MARQQEAIFRAAHPAPPFWAVQFAVSQPPAPGAFMLADLGQPVLEPLYPAGLEDEGFMTMVPPGHPVTRLLPGTAVRMLGPLGRGFRIGDIARLLLIAKAERLPPLLPLLTRAPAVALVVEAATRALLPPVQHIPPAVELYLVTLDGSAGYYGPLEAESAPGLDVQPAGPRVSSLLTWAEHVCLSCEFERYPSLARMVRSARLYPQADFAQALVQVPMPCGVGACEVCRVKSSGEHGRQREYHACTDGPVFDLLRLA